MRLSPSEIERVVARIAAGEVDVLAAGATTQPEPASIISCEQLMERRRAALAPSHG